MTDPGALNPLDTDVLRVPTTATEQKVLRDLLWEALPKPLTLRMARHVMVFRPDETGTLVSTGNHEWGPLRAELELGPNGTVSILGASNTLTGQALDTKALLDLADAAQDALAADPTVGPLIMAMRAVAHQRLPSLDAATGEDSEAQADADVTASALARLAHEVADRNVHHELAALRSALAHALAERDDARAWARAEHHRRWEAPRLPANRPDWLINPR